MGGSGRTIARKPRVHSTGDLQRFSSVTARAAWPASLAASVQDSTRGVILVLEGQRAVGTRREHHVAENDLAAWHLALDLRADAGIVAPDVQDRANPHVRNNLLAGDLHLQVGPMGSIPFA